LQNKSFGDEHDLRLRNPHGKEWQENVKNERCRAKFLCPGCGKQQVDTDFKRMWYTKEIVETSMGLRSEGLSLKRTRIRTHKIKKILVKSNQTILNWYEKFGKKLAKSVQGLKDRLHGDETLLKTLKKGIFFFFWAMRCAGCQPVGWHVSTGRDMHETRMLLWEARRRFPIGYLQKAIRTDKMPAYPFAIAKVFNHEVKHEKQISFKHGINAIECFWRCKGKFPKFGSLNNAKIFIDHWMWENYGDDSFFSIDVIRLLEVIEQKNYL